MRATISTIVFPSFPKHGQDFVFDVAGTILSRYEKKESVEEEWRKEERKQRRRGILVHKPCKAREALK